MFSPLYIISDMSQRAKKKCCNPYKQRIIIFVNIFQGPGDVTGIFSIEQIKEKKELGFIGTNSITYRAIFLLRRNKKVKILINKGVIPERYFS